MSEQDSSSSLPEGESNKDLVPIGDRILGVNDPRKMSRQEFDSSPDLLFHGAVGPFVFERKIISGPNSQTVGVGFYATDDRENASLYSKIRKNFQGEPDVVKMLPYQARVLDLRSQDNPQVNTPVTQEFITKYRDYVIAQLQSRFPDGQPDVTTDWQNTLRFQKLTGYRSRLNGLIFGQGRVDLREMMTPTMGAQVNFLQIFLLNIC
jgi:hypothetical protein